MKKFFAVLVIFVTVESGAIAQDYSNAGSYMSYFSEQHKMVSKDMWDYMSAIARGKNARKVEARRKELLKSLLDAKRKIAAVKPYKGDAGLRDSTVSYLMLNYNILHEDFEKIVDMEEIAEQSYDAMETYMTIRKRANEKMNDAGSSLEAEQRRFAADHKLNLIEDDSKLSKKLERAGEAFDYYDEIFLLLFKSQVRENTMIDAQNKENLSTMEQSKNALQQNSNEGLEALKDVKPFNGDNSLVLTCKNLLLFYKKESEEKAQVIMDFFLKKENFEKLKASMDAKGKSATQEDVNKYNASLKDYNALINKYNLVNNELNKERGQKLTAWNEAVKAFLDKHAS